MFSFHFFFSLYSPCLSYSSSLPLPPPPSTSLSIPLHSYPLLSLFLPLPHSSFFLKYSQSCHKYYFFVFSLLPSSLSPSVSLSLSAFLSPPLPSPSFFCLYYSGVSACSSFLLLLHNAFLILQPLHWLVQTLVVNIVILLTHLSNYTSFEQNSQIYR